MKKFLLLIGFIAAGSALWAQWGPDVRLTNNPANPYNSNWCVAANGNTVHVAWFEDRDGYRAVYYKRSTDGGVTWGADTRITNNTFNNVYYPVVTIAVSGTLVHVAWHAWDGGGICYKRSTDGGVTWGAETPIIPGICYNPVIAAFGSTVHIAWPSYSGTLLPEIWYKRSTDGGVTWDADKRLTYSDGYSQGASIAVSGSTVHVVWGESRVPNGIYYKRSTDGGVTWGADTWLTNSGNESIAASGSTVHLVWNDASGEIYYKRSTDGGATWGVDTRLTNNPAQSLYPSVAVSGNNIHVIWQDTRDGNFEIYYKSSTDGGVTWGADTRLTNNSATSYYPSAAVAGNNIHVVWIDTRDGNPEMYYKGYVPPNADLYIQTPLLSGIQPAANQVWAGAVYSPYDTVGNLGPGTATTVTTFCYIDAWSNSQSIGSLTSGAKARNNFAGWTASLIPNTSHSRCDTTYAASPTDPNLANNKVTASYTAVYDGQVVSIGNPPTNPWCGAAYSPSATVRNNSAAGSATFTVTCTITGGYTSTKTVTGLAAGTNTTVTFDPWTASRVPNTSYTVTVTCQTTGDINAANNVQTRTITTIYDGESVDIDVPPDTVNTGTSYTPEATVRNSSGAGAADFSVACTINPGGYSSTINILNLGFGVSSQAVFAGWTSPLAAGVTYTMTVTCQTTGDVNTANNTITKTIFAYGDVGVLEPHYPTPPVGTVYAGENVYLGVILKNYTPGFTEPFDVNFQVEDEAASIVYDGITPATAMNPNEDREFYAETPWTPSEDDIGKTFILRTTSTMTGDGNPTNNITEWAAVVIAQPGSDVRPKSIDSPNSASSGAVYTPKATVENPGTNPASFWTYCKIDAGLFKAAYIDSILVDNLKAGDSQPLTFKDWTAEAGSYVLTVYTALTGDEHPENDTATLQLTSTGIAETKQLLPTAYSLESSRPNPFYSTTEIRYGIPITSRINLAIYDITGKLVKTLVNGTENLGFHKIAWNGNDNAGKRLGSGLYFIRFESPTCKTTAKLILVR